MHKVLAGYDGSAAADHALAFAPLPGVYALPCAFNKSASICATLVTEGRAFQRSI